MNPKLYFDIFLQNASPMLLVDVSFERVVTWNAAFEHEMNLPSALSAEKKMALFHEAPFYDFWHGEKKKAQEPHEERLSIPGKGNQWFLAERRLLLDGESPYLLISLLNITQKKRAEQELAFRLKMMEASEKALNENHEKLKETLSLARVGYWSLNCREMKSEIELSEEMENILGYPLQEMIPTYEWFLERIHGDERNWAHQFFLRLSDGEMKNTTATFRFIHKNGEILTCRLLAKREGNTPYRQQGTLQDVTMVKRMQEEKELIQKQLIHSAKLASLGEMASGIAHEVNNPLTIIHGHCQILKDINQKNEMKPETLDKSLNVILKTVDRISKVIQSLREFSREGANERFQKISLKQIIEKTFIFCHERLITHGIDVSFSPPSEDVFILCRESQMMRVLFSLLTNAHDAVVKMEKPWIKIEVEYNQERVKISVIDSGRGIEEGVREKIMNPFFTTKPVGEGAGLGLSTSYGIIKEHGGMLSLDSFSPHTKFDIVLPRERTNS